MKRLQDVANDVRSMGSVVQLTGAFEGIASMNIVRLKDRVARSEEFFYELWQVYTQLRVSKEFLTDRKPDPQGVDKELLIIITSEGSLSGDIDQRLVEYMLKDYDPQVHDILAIGNHGRVLLKQRGVSTAGAYELPDKDVKIDTAEIVAVISRYKRAVAYYQAYVSLMNQEVRSIELGKAVQERGDKIDTSEDIISDTNFIFEPSVMGVVEYMEHSMLGVAINELVFASKLAQQASRYRAMSAAQIKAKESATELKAEYGLIRRKLKDEQTREIIASLDIGVAQ